MASWDGHPEVLQTFGITSSGFAASGLNKLTRDQLTALETAVKPDPRKHILTCSANPAPAAKIHILLKISGDDATPAIVNEIHDRVAAVNGIQLVDTAAEADRSLRVVIQQQTMGKRILGYTASYVTGTPCTEEIAGKKTDVELKGQLGVYTDPKSAAIAQSLATMLDQELQPLRPGAATGQ